jgi:hypothetical protein
MAGELALVSDPIDSCALDWLSTSFRFANNDRLDDLYADVSWLGDQFCPGGEWSKPKPAMHFTHSRRHESGISFSYTPWQSAAGNLKGARNEGVASVEVTGSFLGSITASARQLLYITLRSIPGFYRCNRLDAQITKLNPPVTALDFMLLVEQQMVWPVGFGRGQAYCERTQSGQVVGGVTQYFGGKTSRRRVRAYDKAKEQGWPMPALRVELQERREAARDHFLWLVRNCENDPFNGTMYVTAEDKAVRALLADGLDLRDTSAWKDGERPQNWAQYAPTPQWWKEMVATTVSPIAVQYRKPSDLAATWEAAVAQYGRKVALEAIRRAVVEGSTFEYQMLLWGLRGAQSLRREDQAVLLALLPEELHDDARDYLRKVQEDAAEYSEAVVE